jgi:hypothetical protein
MAYSLYDMQPHEYFGTTVYVPTLRVRPGRPPVPGDHDMPVTEPSTGYTKAWFRKKATPQRVPGPVFARWLVEDWQAGWCTKHRKPEDEQALMEYLSRDAYERVAYSMSAQDWRSVD